MITFVSVSFSAFRSVHRIVLQLSIGAFFNQSMSQDLRLTKYKHNFFFYDG